MVNMPALLFTLMLTAMAMGICHANRISYPVSLLAAAAVGVITAMNGFVILPGWW